MLAFAKTPTVDGNMVFVNRWLQYIDEDHAYKATDLGLQYSWTSPYEHLLKTSNDTVSV